MILKKKILRKDIRQSFIHSWGRFFSILCLMALGSFALVGLKVTGPNMRTTTENYFNQLNLADVSIIGSYGIDESDQKIINSANNIDKVDYGYLKDVVIQDTKTSIRIFSTTDDISLYELVDGKLPESEDEIAISNEYSDKYKIGRMINFNEAKDITGNTTLTRHEFKVVGYVNSSEIISSVNLGQTTTIFLEYLTPIWNRLSFTQKVTARNIFRYKKRMLMTIFGVCGSVAILFAGFGVQHSISGIIDRQFGEVIHYDLILAHNEHLKEDQQEELNELLGSDAVTQYNSIYYEELSKVAGNSNDKQIIKLIVPDDINTFSEYIKLVNRESSEELSLKDEGAIISERLAKLLDIEHEHICLSKSI